MRDKKGQTIQWGYYADAALLIGVIIVAVIIYMLLSGKGWAWLDFFKNLARGR